MNPLPTSTASESTTQPSDPYVVTPEIVPDTTSVPANRPKGDSDEEDNEKVIYLDGEAYNALTKPDPHWATSFTPSEVRGERWSADFLKLDKERYFRMLSAIHRGEKNGPTWEHSELHTYRLRKFLVENIGQRLNMTDLQIERATARATNIDGQKFGQRLELAVFCTCAYVVHRDQTGYAKDRHYHPNKTEKDELFEKVAEMFELAQHRIDNVCRMFDQIFGELPPVEFDERKPEWKANEEPDQETITSHTADERVGQRWKGGI